MIIYGRRVTPLRSLQLQNEVCANCNTRGSIVLSVFAKYAHIFWLPTFPMGRVGASTCTNCKQTLEDKEMPTFLRLQYQDAVAQTKIPLWTWSGLALIVILVGVMSYNISVRNANEKLYIGAPVEGDVYQYKTETGGYSLMKVVEVLPDSLVVQVNQFEVDKMTGVYSLKDKPYEEDGYIVSKAEILDMYNSKRIYGVDRED